MDSMSLQLLVHKVKYYTKYTWLFIKKALVPILVLLVSLGPIEGGGG